ncbi:MAG: long-chain acyl-CoA synthetase, partial [Streblomastix strix]
FPMHNGYNSTLTLLNEMKLVSVPEMNYFAQPQKTNENKDNEEELNKQNTSSSQTQVVFRPAGEACFRGPCIFSGYWKNPELTAETIDSEGWLHTGDIGEVDPTHNNYLRIIDRKKNIFKMNQGEYIQPEQVEQSYGDNCPAVQQIYVYGSPFYSKLVAVVVPNEEVILKLIEKGDLKIDRNEVEHKEGEQQSSSATKQTTGQQFISDIIEYSTKLKKPSTQKDKSSSSKQSDPLDLLIKYYLSEFDRILTELKLPHFQRLFGLIIEPEAWSVENGFFSPTQKLKRFMLRSRYEKELEGMLDALGNMDK